MNISQIVESTQWKKFIAKLYGWGASVVIIGALFKIQHWPGAGPMLTIGLLTEAVIFFFSAFEPLHEELDWTLVYPELAGMAEDDEMEAYKESVIGQRANSVLEKFDNLVSGTNISEEAINRVGEGLSKLGSTASHMSDISESTLATKAYIENFKTAAVTMDSLTNTYTAGSESLQTSMGALSQSYSKVAEIVEQSGQKVSQQIDHSTSAFTENYDKLNQAVTGYQASIAESSKNYGAKLNQLGLNVEQLNSMYELQLKETQSNLKNAEKLYGGVEMMLQNLNASVSETNKYREEIEKLSQNLASLNTVYGNMLSAMNVVKR
jgi:gliding motility-associated protein GldL